MRVLFICLASVIGFGTLVGCSSDGKVELLTTEITLIVGETRSVLPYVDFSATASDRSIALKSDSDCVEARGNELFAAKVGSAVVSVKALGKTFDLNVDVISREPSGLTLISGGNTVQTVAIGDKPQGVLFTAQTDSDILPVWNDGEYTGTQFEYTPNGYGEFRVKAQVGEFVELCTVVVYKPTDVEVKINGEINQAGTYSTVRFSARESVDTTNPRSVYDWRVNGASVGDSAVFDFTPTVDGEYDVSLFVNGKRRNISGKESIKVVADGKPRAGITFDDESELYIYWDSGYPSYVSITNPSGKRRIFDVTDAQYSHLFSDGRFRATEYIDIFGDGEYNITLGGESNNDIVFRQIDSRAEDYLNNKILCKNSYISSEADVAPWVYELYACGKTTADCYVENGVDTERVTEIIHEVARSLGLTAVTKINANIVGAEFNDYVNYPSDYEKASVVTVYSVLPHIEYDNALRASDYVFYTDRIKNSVRVDGSEQLLCAVLEGYRPIPISDSAALAVYRAAKSVLLRIIGAGYNSEQKIHAIYDWLQWVSVKSQSTDGKWASGYLEGVFSSPRNGGSRYVVNSVGAAKAFALMCALEGIECDIRYGGRWYNTVVLNGVTYNVDVFGGKISGSEYNQANSEMTSHRGLLIDDAALSELGIELDGQSDAFDVSKGYYLNKFTYNDIYFDYYIDVSEKSDYDIVEAAVFTAFNAARTNNYKIPFVTSEVLYGGGLYGVEFYIGELSTDEISALCDNISKAAKKYAADNGCAYSQQSVRQIGNVLGFVASPSTEKER